MHQFIYPPPMKSARARAALLIALALTVTLPLIGQTAGTTTTYGYARQWGSLGGPSTPYGVALDTSGNVYITDACPYNGPNCAIGEMASNGTLVKMWGSRGSGPGQLNNPLGIAIDSSGHIFVTDAQNNNVQKFDNNGNLLTSWNSNGTTNGQLSLPIGVAVNATGYVYVVDSGNHRIGIFRNDGSFISYFRLATPGNFLSPYGIAIDPQGSIYVTDSAVTNGDAYASNVTMFTKTGTFVRTWDAGLSPQGLAIDGASNVYVVDNYIGITLVKKFDTTGKLLLSFGSNGNSPGQFSNPEGVALDAQSNVYVSDPGNFNVQKFSGTDGHYISTLAYQRPGKFYTPNQAALDSSGNIYVADTGNDRVQKFKLNGTLLTSWGTPGNGTGHFDSPTGIAVDTNGNIYVTDYNNNRVQKFLQNGTFVKSWGTFGNCLVGCLNGQFYQPSAIATDSSNNVYVTDSQNNRVEKFDSQGNFITTWGSMGLGPGQFNMPQGIAVDASGNVYVSDSSNNRIEKFNSSGSLIAAYGSYGQGNGRFSGPSNVATDPAGNIFIADTYNNRIQELASNGTFLTSFGTQGSANGQLMGPAGVTVDGNNNIYVVDTNVLQTGTLNNRIEVFAPTHNLAATGIALSRRTSYSGVPLSQPVNVNVMVSNLGSSNETVLVQALANASIIGQQNITIGVGQSLVVSFSWYPNLYPRGAYVITGQVQVTPGDPNPADNIIQGGLFYVHFKGDVNGDCKVNIIDLAAVGSAFGTSSSHKDYSLNADFNNDGTVNIIDLATVGSTFGLSC